MPIRCYRWRAAMLAIAFVAIGPAGAKPPGVPPRLIHPHAHARRTAPRLAPQPTSAPAQAGPRPNVSDRATVNLVRKMLRAQNNLTVEGTLVTETPLGTFVQHAIMDGARAQRFECLSPQANRGEVIVDDGRFRYHVIPNAKTAVQASQMAARRVHVPDVMQEIRQGSLLVQQTGSGTVAGRTCTIVRVGPPYAANWYQYWIDPATGAQLRIEEYDSSNRRLSATYFTDVTYDPAVDRRLLSAPAGALATKPRPREIPHVPTAAEAGFVVLQPSFLPAGFRFQSSVIRQRGASNLVRLVYGNGLDALSLFETHDTQPEKADSGQVQYPRSSVVTVRRNGLVIVLVGSMDPAVMQDILASLH